MLSRVWLFATPWTIAYQDPLSIRILQARILEWVAISSSRGSSQPRDRTHASCLLVWQVDSLPTAPPGKTPSHEALVTNQDLGHLWCSFTLMRQLWGLGENRLWMGKFVLGAHDVGDLFGFSTQDRLQISESTWCLWTSNSGSRVRIYNKILNQTLYRIKPSEKKSEPRANKLKKYWAAAKLRITVVFTSEWSYKEAF